MPFKYGKAELNNMTDQSLKRDAGKPRLDLVPWFEFPETDTNISVEVMALGLKQWWCGRPFSAAHYPIPRRQLLGVAKVLAFGASKYQPRGWEAGITYSRVFAAAIRHADAHAAGDLLDAETGLPHESHFWCNVMFLVVFAQRGRDAELDDRPAPVAAVRECFNKLEAEQSARESFVAALTGTGKGAVS